jgi:hypothetical protein
MDSYLKFTLIALASILIGIPLWTAIFAPEQLSVTIFTELGFWIPAVIGMALLLFGFWAGQRMDIT